MRRLRLADQPVKRSVALPSVGLFRAADPFDDVARASAAAVPANLR